MSSPYKSRNLQIKAGYQKFIALVSSYQLDAFFKLGRLSRRSVAIARLRTFRFLMCISSRWIILFT